MPLIVKDYLKNINTQIKFRENAAEFWNVLILNIGFYTDFSDVYCYCNANYDSCYCL